MYPFSSKPQNPLSFNHYHACVGHVELAVQSKVRFCVELSLHARLRNDDQKEFVQYNFIIRRYFRINCDFAVKRSVRDRLVHGTQ